MVAASNAINIVATFNGKQALAGLDKLEKSFGRFKKVVMTVLAGKMVKQAAEFGKQMSLMSDRVGMSVAKLTALKGAFTSAGAGAKGFERTINNISNGLLGISRGNGAFAAKLGMMGISPYGMDGQLKKPDDVLYDIADWAKGQKDSGMMSEQDIMYYLMSELGFDEATAKMAMGGSGAIRENEERARSEGRTLEKGDANTLAATGIKIAEMFEALTVAFERFLVPLTPILDGLSDGFKVVGEAINVVIGPMKEYSAEISMLGKAIGTVVGFVIKVIFGLVNVIGGTIFKVGELIGGALATIGILFDKISNAWGKIKGWFGFGDKKEEDKQVTPLPSETTETVDENGFRTVTVKALPTNTEQATNGMDGKTNIQDNSQTIINVQGNMDSEVYETVKEEQGSSKNLIVLEDMSG